MRNILLPAVVCIGAMSSLPAAAKTVSVGGTLCESLGASTYTATSVGGCDKTIGDLANSAPGNSVNFLGEGTLYGYVADKAGTNNTLYPDYAQITLATDSVITFTLFNTDKAFDALLSFGTFTQLVNQTTSTVSFIAKAGLNSFILDTTADPAINHQAKNGSDYMIEIAPVPLPAGALLMLTGIGGLLAARKKRAA